MEIKINSYYKIKKGTNQMEPECVVQVTKESSFNSNTDAYYTCIRLSDNMDVYIKKYRFIQEITKEKEPEYFL